MIPTPENPIPVRLYNFGADYSYHRVLSCKNHPDLRWTSKNPLQRRTFFYGTAEDLAAKNFRPSVPECDCSVNDMTVVHDKKATE